MHYQKNKNGGKSMKKLLVGLVVFGSLFVWSLSIAGVCTIHYNRTACKGQEKVSYSKCDGAKECDKKQRVDDEAQCKKLAKDACANARLKETKSKVITANYDGKKLLSDKGNEDFCFSYEKRDVEFNQCD